MFMIYIRLAIGFAFPTAGIDLLSANALCPKIEARPETDWCPTKPTFLFGDNCGGCD